MKSKTYKIILYKNGISKEISISSYSLQKLVKDFEINDDEIIIIEKDLKWQKKHEEKNSKDECEKVKYYKAKYSQLYKQHKSNKISNKQFKDTLQRLKELKTESETKEILEQKFEEYKKTNKILPYNVS